MVIADEACEVSDEIFTAIDTLGAEYELLIGNPTNAEGKFYRAFSNPSLGYARYQIPASITPNFTREQIPAHVARQLVSPALVAQWGNDWGAESPLYRSRVLARFPEQDSSVILVPQHWFTYAANRVESQLGKRPAVQLGFDVAHFGSDRTAIAGRIGPVHVMMRSWIGEQDTRLLAAYAIEAVRDLRALCDQYNIDHSGLFMNIDTTGVGAGVGDILCAHDVKTFRRYTFGGAAIDRDHFVRRRDEAYYYLRELFRPDSDEMNICIAIDDTVLRTRLQAQASSVQYGYNEKNQIKVESKEAMKERGIPSPDELDALVLAFAPPTPTVRVRRTSGPPKRTGRRAA
jgi:hypothetical protein